MRLCLALIVLAAGDQAISRHLETIERNPSLPAKEAANEALAKIGRPALAPLLTKIREGNPGYFTQALAAVCKGLGPEGKRFLAKAYLDEKNDRASSELLGIADPEELVRQALKSKSPAAERALTTIVERLLNVDRHEEDVAPILSLFRQHKGPKLLLKALEEVGVPTKANTHTLKTAEISVTALSEFFIELPLPEETTSYSWGFGAGMVAPHMASGSPGLIHVGTTFTAKKHYLRFIATDGVSVPLEIFEEGGIIKSEPKPTHRAVITAKALDPKARELRLAELAKSLDPALRRSAQRIVRGN